MVSRRHIGKPFDIPPQIVLAVLEQLPDKVEAFKRGKKGLIGLFVGEVMKRTRGKADPKITNDLLREALK